MANVGNGLDADMARYLHECLVWAVRGVLGALATSLRRAASEVRRELKITDAARCINDNQARKADIVDDKP
jgi:hypothetical protein